MDYTQKLTIQLQEILAFLYKIYLLKNGDYHRTPLLFSVVFLLQPLEKSTGCGVRLKLCSSELSESQRTIKKDYTWLVLYSCLGAQMQHKLRVTTIGTICNVLVLPYENDTCQIPNWRHVQNVS